MNLTGPEKDCLDQCAAQLALLRAGTYGGYNAFLRTHFYDGMVEGLCLAVEPDTERVWAEGAELDARVERGMADR